MGRVQFYQLEISDTRRFQDVALLIDKEQFQEDLKKLKKELRNLARDFPNRPLGKLLLPAFRLRLAVKLAAKYKYPPGFGRVILALVDKKKVIDQDVAELYVKVNLLSTVLDEGHPYYPRSGEILISIYEYALRDREEKVIKQMEKIVKIFKNLSLPREHPLNQPSIPTIKRQRWLYWVHSTKVVGYKKLAKKEYYDRDPETIRSNINSYKKLLKLRV